MKIDSQRSRLFGAFDLGPGRVEKTAKPKICGRAPPVPRFSFHSKWDEITKPKKDSKTWKYHQNNQKKYFWRDGNFLDNQVSSTSGFSIRYLESELDFNSNAVGWDSRVQTASKSFLWETLFLDQLHIFSLLSSNSFLHTYLKSKFLRKIPWHQNHWIFEC